MQKEEPFRNLTKLCSDYIKKIRATKDNLVNDFLSQESLDLPVISLTFEIPRGRISLVKSIKHLMEQTEKNKTDFRVVVNQHTTLSDPIWCSPTFPTLITTEGCDSVYDVLIKSRRLTKKFRKDFLTKMPEYPNIRKLFQYWDSKIAIRYQKNLDKKIECLAPALLKYITHPQNLDERNKINEIIDSLEALFNMQDSFGKPVPLTAKNDIVIDRIRSIAPQLGDNIEDCFKRVNRQKPVNLEIQMIRDYLCLTR